MRLNPVDARTVTSAPLSSVRGYIKLSGQAGGGTKANFIFTTDKASLGAAALRASTRFRCGAVIRHGNYTEQRVPMGHGCFLSSILSFPALRLRTSPNLFRVIPVLDGRHRTGAIRRPHCTQPCTALRPW